MKREREKLWRKRRRKKKQRSSSNECLPVQKLAACVIYGFLQWSNPNQNWMRNKTQALRRNKVMIYCPKEEEEKKTSRYIYMYVCMGTAFLFEIQTEIDIFLFFLVYVGLCAEFKRLHSHPFHITFNDYPVWRVYIFKQFERENERCVIYFDKRKNTQKIRSGKLYFDEMELTKLHSSIFIIKLIECEMLSKFEYFVCRFVNYNFISVDMPIHKHFIFNTSFFLKKVFLQLLYIFMNFYFHINIDVKEHP